jgi:hypothetical protein
MIILGTNSIKDTGYDVANSCRFNSASSDTMSRDNGTPTNLKKFSISLWFKRTEPGLNKYLITGFDDEDNRTLLQFSSDQLLFQNQTGGSNNTIIKSNAVFRDPSAWYHFCIIVDTTQGTNTNRVKMYVNGSQVTSLASSTYPDQNTDLELTDAANSILLNQKGDGSDFNSGYYSEVVVLDGTAASITDFGEFDSDSNIWKPIDVSGLTFGTNGFYLDFEDSSALGNDANGGTDFTVNNLTAIDQSTDTCTNNFCTLNPLSTLSGPTLSEGNTKFDHAVNEGDAATFGTFGLSSGKWYWEIKALGANVDSVQKWTPGVIGADDHTLYSNRDGGFAPKATALYLGNSNVYQNDSSVSTAYFTAVQNDIIGIALDVDNLKIYWHKNGTYGNSGDPTSGGTGTGAISLTASHAPFIPHAGEGSGAAISFSFNFGNPSFAISSGNTDGNGYGNFEYAVPSGYYSLNTKNLAEYG